MPCPAWIPLGILLQELHMADKNSPANPEPLAQNDMAISLDVEPRKPRLAWQGMERRALVGYC
jgi:hypothetical protein